MIKKTKRKIRKLEGNKRKLIFRGGRERREDERTRKERNEERKRESKEVGMGTVRKGEMKAERKRGNDLGKQKCRQVNR